MKNRRIRKLAELTAHGVELLKGQISTLAGISAN
jgi:hypothetical protein